MSDREAPKAELPEKLTADTINKLYNSPQNGNPDVYWISTSIIDELKDRVLNK